jgi:glycosyltransferase involved in cell wall biosynthesis
MRYGSSQMRPRIGYLTSNDPLDRRSWSGTQYYIAQALQKHCGDVFPIGPIKPRSVILKQAVQKGLRLLAGRNYLYTHTISLSKQMARIAEKKMANEEFDFIFAPAGSTQIAYLRTNVPLVYLSDTTFAAILNYYPEFSGLSKTCIREGNALEQLAIARARLILYSSSWAAGSARKDYHADPAKLHVIPFGANLEEPPTTEAALQKTASTRCNLLFVGVDWRKKGGDIAFETLVELKRLGISAQLTIVGCSPPDNVRRRDVHVISFLNKNDPVQREQLYKLYLDADFLLLPTRAECYGIVFCEANAFGVPVIATDTGGISEIVRDGENGYLLPPCARGSEYARVIAATYLNKEKYIELKYNSRTCFETRLNWDAWGTAVARLIWTLPRRPQSNLRQLIPPPQLGGEIS